MLILPHSADTAAAGGYLPVIGVLSFLLWYRPIYLGLDRTEGKAMAFFFCERGAALTTLFMMRDIRHTGMSGCPDRTVCIAVDDIR